ncbi:MAG: hypothetical protein KJ906_01380 [Nanoarchaeota archaeon]|nr:hypothetical protein [Nanoarchaeota archaeon]
MEIVKDLMKMGILVDQEAIDALNNLKDTELTVVVEKTKIERPLVLTPELVSMYLKSTKYEIIKQFESKEAYTIQDIVEQLNKRYDFIQGLLMRKVELSNIVSINKCESGKLTVIGLVKKKEDSGTNDILELEDKTGTLKAVISKDLGKDIKIDDVIAVYGNYNNKLLFGETLRYPDVPLRKAGCSEKETRVSFIINYDFQKQMDIDSEYIIISNCDGLDGVKQRYPRSKVFVIGTDIRSPCLINIDGVVFMIILDIDPLKALKRRYVSIDKTDFLVNTVPDIILTNREIETNYKSISVISKSVEINLKTREINII